MVLTDFSGFHLQVAAPQFVTATTTVTSSVLLSPSVFQQSATKATEVENKVNSSSPVTLGTEVQTIPPTVLSRSQLQEALIHLIKVLSLQSLLPEEWGSKLSSQHGEILYPFNFFSTEMFQSYPFLLEGVDNSTLYI